MNKAILKAGKSLVPSIRHTDGSIQSSTITGFGLIAARVAALLGGATFLQVPGLFEVALAKVPAITILSEAAWFAITIYNIWKNDAVKIDMKVALENWADKQGYKKEG